MSVGLYKYDGDIGDKKSELVLSENIASQQFYEKYWKKAIDTLKIKYIQDGAEIDITKKNIALEELKLILNWAEKNIQGKDLEHIRTRIKNLQRVISIALKDDGDILYIF